MKTKWKKAKFLNRFGKEESGDVAYENEKEVVVAVERKPMMVPGPYGLKVSSTVYETVQRQYILTID